MNIMHIEIEAESKDDYLAARELMDANAPCIAFIKIEYKNPNFRDGYVTQYFVGVSTGEDYYTVSVGEHLYKLYIVAMNQDDEPILDTDGAACYNSGTDDAPH